MVTGLVILVSFFVAIGNTESHEIPVKPVMGTETYGPMFLPRGPYDIWLEDERNWLQDPSDVSVTIISGDQTLEADVPDEITRMNWHDFDYVLVGTFSYISAGDWEIVLEIQTPPVSEMENLNLLMISWDSLAEDGMITGAIVASAGIAVALAAVWRGVKVRRKEPQ